MIQRFIKTYCAFALCISILTTISNASYINNYEIELLEQAELEGDFQASKQLAQMYLEGCIVKTDAQFAFEKYQDMAEYSDFEASYCAGSMLYQGYGAQKSLEDAKRYLKKPAYHNHEPAIIMYNAIQDELGKNDRIDPIQFKKDFAIVLQEAKQTCTKKKDLLRSSGMTSTLNGKARSQTKNELSTSHTSDSLYPIGSPDVLVTSQNKKPIKYKKLHFIY